MLLQCVFRLFDAICLDELSTAGDPSNCVEVEFSPT